MSTDTNSKGDDITGCCNNPTPTSFVTNFKYRLKHIIYAPDVPMDMDPNNNNNNNTSSRKHIRVGLIGGDIPIFPPLAMVLFCMLGMCSWYITSKRYEFVKPQILGQSLYIRLLYSFGIFVTGMKCLKSCRIELTKFGTSSNFQPVTKICNTGLYSISRNFMYIGVLLINISLSIAFNTLWLVTSTCCMFLYLQYIVIPTEELFLKEQFGKEYDIYCSQVPRWINLTSILQSLFTGKKDNDDNDAVKKKE